MKRTKKRVLLVGSDLAAVRGGMVSMIRNLLEYEGWEEFELSYLVSHTEGSRAKKVICFLKGYIKLVTLLIGRKVDILHLHVSERGSIYRKAAILFLAKKLKYPVIVHHHGAEFWDFYAGLTEKKKWVVRKFIEMADRNILLSEKVCRDFQSEFPKARMAVIGNAVRVPAQNPYSGGDDVVLTLGRLGERKGTYVLLKAYRDVMEDLPNNFVLWLCGDGETERAEEFASQLGMTNRIGHIGWVSGEEREHALKRSLIHVLPSYQEVLPMSILESMAMGIPNISTSIASIPEVIEHGVNGYLTEPGNVEMLAELIKKLCLDKELRMQMSDMAYKTVRDKFSVPVCCERIGKLYREILDSDRQVL